MLMQKIEGSAYGSLIQSDYSHMSPFRDGDVYTSIDIDLQDVAERAIDEAIEKSRCFKWLCCVDGS